MAVTLCHECQEDIRDCHCPDNPDRKISFDWRDIKESWADVKASFEKFGYYDPDHDQVRKNHKPHSEKAE